MARRGEEPSDLSADAAEWSPPGQRREQAVVPDPVAAAVRRMGGVRMVLEIIDGEVYEVKVHGETVPIIIFPDTYNIKGAVYQKRDLAGVGKKGVRQIVRWDLENATRRGRTIARSRSEHRRRSN